MQEITITITLQVSHVEDSELTADEARAAAVQAITHAVKYGEGEGFVHDRADDLSIGVVAVE